MCVTPMNPRPTTPTLMVFMLKWSGGVLECCGSVAKFCEIFAGGADVSDALLAGFTFDGEVALETQFSGRLEECAPINLPRSYRDFLAPSARNLGLGGVLDVALFQPRT